MTEWVEQNLSLLTAAYPDLEYRPEGGVHWVRIPSYPIPDAGWAESAAEVAFRNPPLAGETPYGFSVRPGLTPTNGAPIGNYTYPASTPWGNDWGQFSFSPIEPWLPKADIRAGPNMLNFVRGIFDRLKEGA